MFFCCAVSQAASISFWLKHAATRQKHCRSHYKAHGVTSSPLPCGGQSLRSPESQIPSRSDTKSSYTLFPFSSNHSKTRPFIKMKSINRGNFLYQLRVSVALRTEETSHDRSLIVKASFKVPLEKKAKILWRVEELVASQGQEHKPAHWGEEQAPPQGPRDTRRL